MKIHRIDHVGVVVHDLPAAKSFFLTSGSKSSERGKWRGSGSSIG
jgi:hypothetical protein